jgi:four helix bundle protein
MTNFPTGFLPYEKLIAYQEALRLLAAVREACIAEEALRDQALRAAASVCLNIAEGAGRRGAADKARVYAIARGECCEAAAALDIALTAGLCRAEVAERGVRHAKAVHALLSGLIRRFAQPSD